ncbi:MAG: glycosyltransferase [Actinomycetota bacterium]|nr:glycosyltransferase [Actinomycetota bacterium]
MARIVHLANFFGPRSGGLRTTMTRLAEGYIAAGHEVHMVIPNQPSGWRPKTQATVHSLASIAIPRSGGYRIVLSTRHIRQALDTIEPDIVELSDRLTLLSAARWARKNNTQCTLFAHERIDGVLAEYASGLPGRGIANRMNERIASEVDTIVTTTRYAAAEFDRISIPTCHVPLGVDTDRFRPLVRNSDDARPIDLVLCSRLSPEKHPHKAIEVLAAGHRLGRKWHLTVVGDGPRMRDLRKMADGLPVTFVGFVSSPQDVAAILQRSDVALAPGPIETFGLAALEALSCGTPVVCSNRSALPEVVGQAGYAVSENVDAWIRAIDRLVHPSQLHVRTLAREQALQLPWQRAIDRMLTIHGLMAATPSTEIPKRFEPQAA